MPNQVTLSIPLWAILLLKVRRRNDKSAFNSLKILLNTIFTASAIYNVYQLASDNYAIDKIIFMDSVGLLANLSMMAYYSIAGCFLAFYIAIFSTMLAAWYVYC
jgi:hypothetical protein